MDPKKTVNFSLLTKEARNSSGDRRKAVIARMLELHLHDPDRLYDICRLADRDDPNLKVALGLFTGVAKDFVDYLRLAVVVADFDPVLYDRALYGMLEYQTSSWCLGRLLACCPDGHSMVAVAIDKYKTDYPTANFHSWLGVIFSAGEMGGYTNGYPIPLQAGREGIQAAVQEMSEKATTIRGWCWVRKFAVKDSDLHRKAVRHAGPDPAD